MSKRTNSLILDNSTKRYMPNSWQSYKEKNKDKLDPNNFQYSKINLESPHDSGRDRVSKKK